MAKVTETNRHIAEKAKREAAVGRFVAHSSAIEGIKVAPPATRDSKTGRFVKKSA